MDDKKSQEYLKESGQFFTMEEIYKMDGIIHKKNKEITRKICEIGAVLVEIGNLSGDSDSEIQKLRDTCLAVMENLEKEQEENKGLNERICLLEKKCKELEDKNLKTDSEWTAKYQEEITIFQEALKKYETSYEDTKKEKVTAESSLKQYKEDLEEEKAQVTRLQGQLSNEQADRKAKEGKIEALETDLAAKDKEIKESEDKVKQYESKEAKMPALMRLYDAYNEVMEKRKELPKAFTEHLQRAVPMDDFDSFLTKIFKRLFPTNCYMSIQAFTAACDKSGEISDEDKKEALRITDGLLREVFAFGSEYFGEEKIYRLDIKDGDQFDSGSCIYMDGKGTMYGKIAEVLLHGIKDEKNNRIYHTYVEGE